MAHALLPHLHCLAWALPWLMVACTNTPSAASSTACLTPPVDADWPVSPPATAGFDAQALCKALQQGAQSRANIHALLVERHAKLVGEVYRKGPDLPITFLYGLWHPFAADTAFDARTLHDVRSVSKSIVGLLYGIALEQGKAPPLDAAVLGIYPALHDLRNPDRDAIQVRHLLTMTSGLAWHEWGHGALSSDETRLYWKADPARFLFDREQAQPPGSTFNYNGGGTSVLAGILAQQGGASLTDLARRQLFEPLGIRQWTWVSNMHERPLAFSGLRMTPRDMLKIGRLINNQGMWHGQQIVPAAWIAQSIHPHIQTPINLLSLGKEPVGYGYQWWAGSVRWKGRVLGWASAMGNGGQRIFVVPQLDLSVVLTAGDYGSAQIHAIENQILAAVVDAVAEP